MAQVIATSKHGMLQNQHGGVRFFNSPFGKISEEISDEQADQFVETPDHFKRHLGEAVEPPVAKRSGPPLGKSAPATAASKSPAAAADQPNF
jgi:hypothetical protein